MYLFIYFTVKLRKFAITKKKKENFFYLMLTTV